MPLWNGLCSLHIVVFTGFTRFTTANMLAHVFKYASQISDSASFFIGGEIFAGLGKSHSERFNASGELGGSRTRPRGQTSSYERVNAVYSSSLSLRHGDFAYLGADGLRFRLVELWGHLTKNARAKSKWGIQTGKR